MKFKNLNEKMSNSKDIMILDLSNPEQNHPDPHSFSKNPMQFEGFDSMEKLYLKGQAKDDVSFTHEGGNAGTDKKGNNLMERCKIL